MHTSSRLRTIQSWRSGDPAQAILQLCPGWGTCRMASLPQEEPGSVSVSSSGPRAATEAGGGVTVRAGPAGSLEAQSATGCGAGQFGGGGITHLGGNRG